ncbi:hypothetical protein VPNG_08259 [Cytospora leucostoma]|uniref:BTB domain-containing protein n=1 Tax=Cytospora leucostoma TaxID=1230097 RepID=A0A423WBY6_9PEZI|nr:hypothetical protein VPNG_08259 [Cytospora leucostoma]
MSSQIIQASATLEQADAEAMPLPDSRPDSPRSTNTKTDSQEPCESGKPEGAENSTAEYNEMTGTDEIVDDKCSLRSAFSEPSPTSPMDEASAGEFVAPEITISVVDSEGGASQSVEGNSLETKSITRDEPDEDNFLDPNDKTNDGDVVKYFFTSSTRKRSHSPVSSEPGCCNPHLHPDSDLYIKARDKNGQAFVFEVVSTILEKASPKFEKMIYCTHVRGNKEEWVWELSDNPLGLKIMFCLLHNTFPRAMLATKPNPSQLYAFLRVLEKYEVDLETTNFHLLARSWVVSFRKGLQTSKLDHIQALYVAYKLGDFKSLKETIRQVAHGVIIGEDGSLRDKNGHRIQDIVPIENELIKSIEKIRNKDVEEVLKSLKEPYEYFMDAEKSTGQNYCKSMDGHLECNQKLLGSLLSNLLQQKLFPVPDPQEYTGSFYSLAEKVMHMDIRGLFYPGVEMHKQRHTICKLGQDTVVEKLLGGTEYLALPADLVEHMYLMCKRCGSFRDERKEFEAYREAVRDVNLLDHNEFRKDVWGWLDPDDPETDTQGDDSLLDEDSGFIDVADHSVWIERKVSD